MDRRGIFSISIFCSLIALTVATGKLHFCIISFFIFISRKFIKLFLVYRLSWEINTRSFSRKESRFVARSKYFEVSCVKINSRRITVFCNRNNGRCFASRRVEIDRNFVYVSKHCVSKSTTDFNDINYKLLLLMRSKHNSY